MSAAALLHSRRCLRAHWRLASRRWKTALDADLRRLAAKRRLPHPVRIRIASGAALLAGQGVASGRTGRKLVSQPIV